jgi:cell division protein FtsQ
MELGRLQLEQRLQRFVRSWPMVLAHAAERISVIDLRYSNGFAVRWQLDNSDKQAS